MNAALAQHCFPHHNKNDSPTLKTTIAKKTGTLALLADGVKTLKYVRFSAGFSIWNAWIHNYMKLN